MYYIIMLIYYHNIMSYLSEFFFEDKSAEQDSFYFVLVAECKINSHISGSSQRRATAGTEPSLTERRVHEVPTCWRKTCPSLLNNACRPVTSLTPPDSSAGAISHNLLYLHSTWLEQVSVYASRHVNVLKCRCY